MLKNETDTALAYLSRFAKLIRNVLDNSQLNNISITRETEMLENYRNWSASAWMAASTTVLPLIRTSIRTLRRYPPWCSNPS